MKIHYEWLPVVYDDPTDQVIEEYGITFQRLWGESWGLTPKQSELTIHIHLGLKELYITIRNGRR